MKLLGGGGACILGSSAFDRASRCRKSVDDVRSSGAVLSPRGWRTRSLERLILLVRRREYQGWRLVCETEQDLAVPGAVMVDHYCGCGCEGTSGQTNSHVA